MDFTEMTFDINDSFFRYGLVIDAAIKFVAIAAVVFFAIVKPVQAMMARRARGEEPEEEAAAPTDETVLLTEIRDLLAQRQLWSAGTRSARLSAGGRPPVGSAWRGTGWSRSP